MLIAIGSLKNAPGVTTWSLALAARWPHPMRSVLVECDPSGGSIAARFRLAQTPGLASLTAATRRDGHPHLLWSHVQQLPNGLPVVCAPEGAQFTHAALAALLASHPTSALRAAALPNTAVIADCGRLTPDSPAMAIAREADHVLLLTRPRADDLGQLAAALTMVDLWSLRPRLLLAGAGHSPTEITHELGIPVAGSVPHDPAGARALAGYADPHQGSRRSPHRSRIGRAALTVANVLLTPPADRPRTQPTPVERRVSPTDLPGLAPLISPATTNPTPGNGQEL
ncbi:hypothetical protein CLV71_11479 [Actinophytocola oryzae]|uniref:MinD-like ATPase involved in chromosome partitioning or flagellar assembly n=2 Tax=Actinophytocola oryzae TaxID=502181 RepID=A0A4R7V5F7_9PSEU|nr:hypothetical protein CLV71_11479 [Actinophytocola oryzae]